jgi:hypothetical protein
VGGVGHLGGGRTRMIFDIYIYIVHGTKSKWRWPYRALSKEMAVPGKSPMKDHQERCKGMVAAAHRKNPHAPPHGAASSHNSNTHYDGYTLSASLKTAGHVKYIHCIGDYLCVNSVFPGHVQALA